MDKLIYGADTETFEGPPMTFQFYSEDTPCEQLSWVKPSEASSVFLKWCKQRKRNVQHVVYVHNLKFDIVSFLWDIKEQLVSSGGDFSISKDGLNIRGVYGTPTFFRVTNGHDISVTVVDSSSYFKTSVKNAAEIACPHLPKLKHPKGLGKKMFRKSDAEFCDYAMRDAVVAYHLGKIIEKMHEEHDIPQSVSIADMSAKIFRKDFLRYTIPQPNRLIVEASLLSYHGGKNNTVAGPGWHPGVASLDLRSAFPHAMRELPAFSQERLYKRYKIARSTQSVPPIGVYCVSGTVADCPWPSVFSHSFKPLRGCKIADIWMQGFELNEALKSKELKLSKIRGHWYDSDKDHVAPSLREFVDHFYPLKSLEKNPAKKYLYKIILNSLYGKFIQTRKRGMSDYTDCDAGVSTTAADLVAGGMFHPFIASAITAHTRARIHVLEHEYEALHTATDGILTRSRDLPREQSGIGSLSLEIENADLLLLRNKCYILYGPKPPKAQAKEIKESKTFPGRFIYKSATHGYQGKLWQLERMVGTGSRTYTVTKVNQLKESINRGLVPNKFVVRERSLNIGPLEIHE